MSDQENSGTENDATDTNNVESNQITRKPRTVINGEKLQVLRNMIIAGSTTSQIATVLDISKRGAQRWTRKLDLDPETTISKSGRRPMDRNLLHSTLQAIISTDNSLTGKGISERLTDEIHKSPSTLSRELKKMGYTRKRLKPIMVMRNSERVICERHIFALQMISKPDEQLIYIDETGFNLHTNQNYGYAPIGATPWINVPTQRGRNLSAIAAISINGILSYKIQPGAFNAIVMEEWCRISLRPTVVGPAVYLMDNARFHHSEIVITSLTSNESSILFLSPYSPHLNPIEQVFASLKGRYMAYHPRPTNQEELVAAIESIFIQLAREPLSAYYREMRRWLILAQQRQPFI